MAGRTFRVTYLGNHVFVIDDVTMQRADALQYLHDNGVSMTSIYRIFRKCQRKVGYSHVVESSA
jgi:hypothetical protein